MLSSALAYAASASVVLIFAFEIARRKSLSTRQIVVLTCLQWMSILAAFGFWTYRLDGTALSEEGYSNAIVAQRLDEMEEYLASDARDSSDEKTFRVCVLGDSTHAYQVPPNQYVIAGLRRVLNEHRKEDIDVFGYHCQGSDAYDFYLVLHRLILEKPDLVVVPVNLRIFGEGWSRQERFAFPSLQRFIPLADYPSVLALSSDHREFAWEHMLLYRWDHLLFGDRMAPFLAGIRNLYTAKEDRAIGFVEDSARDYAIPLSTLTDTPEPSFEEFLRGTYTSELFGTHYMLEVFRELSRYARENGAQVLYYAVQTPAPRARQKANFQMIERNLRRDPGVHFADLSRVLDADQFSAGEHPTPQGLAILTGHLANEIVALRAIRCLPDAPQRSSQQHSGRPSRRMGYAYRAVFAR